MATFYANANTGNNSNNGTTAALAKLTLAGVNSVASAGDTIMCQGRFLESIPNTKQLFWQGDGYCEFNGNNGVGIAVVASASFSGITFAGFSNAPFYSVATSGAMANDCVFKGMSQAVYCYTGSMTFNRCVFCDNYGYGYNGGAAAGVSKFFNCAFFGNAMDAIAANPTEFYNCIFGSSVMLCCYGASSKILTNNCIYDFTNGKCQFSTSQTDKTTLAAWQASMTTQSVNDADRAWRSDVVDYANRILYPTPASYLLTAGPGATPIGLQKATLGVTGNTNSTYLTGGVFTNTVLDSYNKVVLAAGQTSGTFATDVIDLGANLSLGRLSTWGTEFNLPTNYFDTNTGDSPNYLNYEARGSTTSFLKSDVSPSWITIPRGVEIGAYISSAYRYWQFRFTLRST